MNTDNIVSLNMRSLRDDMEFAVYKISDISKVETDYVVTQPHRINFDAIIFVQQGTGRHHIDYKVYHYQPGTVIFVAKYQVHYFDDNPDLKGYVILFTEQVFSSGKDDLIHDKIRLAMDTTNCIQAVNFDCKTYVDKLYKLVKNRDLISKEIIRALVRALLLEVLVSNYDAFNNNEKHESKNYNRLKLLIENNFQTNHKASDYATMLGVCSKSLNLIAKKHTGRTTKQLIDDRILIELKRRLAFSNDSIQEISFQLGFNEATNMTKFFRRQTDVTPTEFRQLCRYNLKQSDTGKS